MNLYKGLLFHKFFGVALAVKINYVVWWIERKNSNKESISDVLVLS